MKLEFFIIPDQKGCRLDQVVALAADGISRSRAAALISDGNVLVDGVKKRPGYKVKPGQWVKGNLTQPPVVPEPEPLDLNIIHEDRHILVLDKPAGQVVHPAPGHLSGTLVNGLLSHSSCFTDPCWDPLRPGIVHRLDKDTSGLILVAKTPKSLGFLQNEFAQRRVKKEYLALVHGPNIPDDGEIDLPIGRHPRHRKMMAVVDQGGRHARTGFRVSRRFDSAALVQVRLYTGRTHQIRVHFYHQGMPLLGEETYQPRSRRKGDAQAPRQMLHSWRLAFRHPYSGRPMAFESPMPPDFIQTMARLDGPTA